MIRKSQKHSLTEKWENIKERYEKETNFKLGGELDLLCLEFIDELSSLTKQLGYTCVIEGVKMDLWKERVWSLVENAGLLPELNEYK